MEFFTKVSVAKPSFNITHTDKILLLGSCFTENIGNYLSEFLFHTTINPYGIIYNPVSIFKALENCIENKLYTESDLSLRNELYFSYDHHGIFSNTDKEIVLKNINSQIEIAHDTFSTSKYIFITLGTSFVYEHKELNKVVANCHKMPQQVFIKRLLSIDEIKNSFESVKNKLQDKIILFTVSPVRHWRDGAIENQRSKSILIESIHQITNQNANCFYFPAYEIMMDELRDYRFYAEDMIHPNETAVKYIWQRFSETYFNEETWQINKFIEKGNALFAHKIKHKNTQEETLLEVHKSKFLEEFKQKYPDIKFNWEL